MRIELGVDIRSVVGSTETVLAAPTNKSVLHLAVEKGVFRLRRGDVKARTFTAANATERFTATAHGLATGDGPYRVSNSGGALPAGLSASTNYWVIKIDANTFQLALTASDARADVPVPVAISDDGTGTQTIGGVPAAAAATGDYGSLRLAYPSAAGSEDAASMYEIAVGTGGKVTVKGSAGTDILTYWWT